MSLVDGFHSKMLPNLHCRLLWVLLEENRLSLASRQLLELVDFEQYVVGMKSVHWERQWVVHLSSHRSLKRWSNRALLELWPADDLRHLIVLRLERRLVALFVGTVGLEDY